MGVRDLAARARTAYPARLFRAYGECKISYHAAGLAFNMFMSMFPLMLGLLAIVGFVLRDPAQQQQVQDMLLGFFPGSAHGALEDALAGVRDRAGILGLIGIAGVLWTGSGVFAAMEIALGHVYGSEQRGLVRQRLMAFLMTGLFVVVIVASVLANAVLALVRFVPFLNILIGALIWVGFMLVCYRVVPNRTFSTLRQVWPGALLAGVLAEALTLVWPFYTWLAHGFNTYGAAFGLFFLLATWLYLLCQILLLGAVANRMRLGRPDEEGAVASPGAAAIETAGARAADRERDAVQGRGGGPDAAGATPGRSG